MDFNYPYSGNLSLLDRPAVAFFASREVSQAQRRQALRWTEEIIPAGKAVISGSQSPLEKEVFGRLLAARHPIIWALGRALYKRYPPQVEGALAEDRILVFSARSTARTGEWTALARNFLITSVSDESFFVLNDAAGRRSSLEVLAQLEAGTAKQVRILR